MSRRVVITGIGLVSSLGIGTQATWDGLLAGTSGVGRVTQFDVSGFAAQIAGEVSGFDPLDYVDKKDVKKMDVFIQYAMAASQFAVDDSALAITPPTRPRSASSSAPASAGSAPSSGSTGAARGRPAQDFPVLHPGVDHQPRLGPGVDPVRRQGPEPGHLHRVLGVGPRARRVVRDHQARGRRRDDCRRLRGGHHPDEPRRLRGAARAVDAKRRAGPRQPAVRPRSRRLHHRRRRRRAHPRGAGARAGTRAPASTPRWSATA